MFFRHLRTKKHAQRALREKMVIFWKNTVLRMVCLSLSILAALSRTLVPAQTRTWFPVAPMASRGLP